MTPPLALDIDGTLTRPHGDGVDPRVFEVLPEWDAPVVLTTGKAFPYPVSLCHFLGIPERAVAENGGVVLVDDQLTYTGDRERARSAVEEYKSRGGALGWGAADTVNRWRETEVAVHVDGDETLLREVAADHGLEVYDTGYAYHVKTPGVSKGDGLTTAAEVLGLDVREFVAIGDSENDVTTFEVVGTSYAVSNADERAKESADTVLDDAHMDGTLAALADLEGGQAVLDRVESTER
ncbi:phosphoglycolate phosphatase [Halobium salinum]|uniref:Phosphoglycolate phosphatase n=1 Tax=Halobium salinum TaxID=1364940 RepID=A0ABD5P788_9EURY|nr:phosphoglycolate phosphatase [Halobium salinum]